MKIKIIDKRLYYKHVVDCQIDKSYYNLYDLHLELTDKGLQLLFPEDWKERNNSIDITGEFGEDDYIKLGFKII